MSSSGRLQSVLLKMAALLSLFLAPFMAGLIYLFVSRNAPGFEALHLIVLLAVVYSLVFGGSALYLAQACKVASRLVQTGESIVYLRLGLPLVAALVLYLFLDSTVLDYYQPISLYDEVIAALAVVWGSSIVVLLLLAFSPVWADGLTSAVLTFSFTLLLGWPLAWSLSFLNDPQVSEHVSWHHDVFIGGEAGYDIYRIPALLVLPEGSQLADGEILERDRLLAMAEARRDGALDTGVIDLVMKISEDGGASWGQQEVICRYELDGKRGKCGNATPVFDRDAGRVVLAYNLSGISDERNKRRHHALIKTSDNGGRSWSAAATVAGLADNLVFGPGHGVQKRLAPHAGRLVIPAYAGERAEIFFSDNNGQSWQRSAPLDTGNESEVAELSDGSLYITTRHRAPIGRPPKPNGRLYSISRDGGQSWPDVKTDTRLQTPVCQASIASYGDEGGLLFSNPDHFRARTNLKIRYSPDNGATWLRELPVYSGPAGYSVLGVQSDGAVVLLYERGSMSYSEKISFARLEAESIQ